MVMAIEPNCEICGYQNDEDEICIAYELQWDLGWEWSQSVNNDRYSLKLDIMSKIAFHFRPFINIPRLIFNQYDLQID